MDGGSCLEAPERKAGKVELTSMLLMTRPRSASQHVTPTTVRPSRSRSSSTFPSGPRKDHTDARIEVFTTGDLLDALRDTGHDE